MRSPAAGWRLFGDRERAQTVAVWAAVVLIALALTVMLGASIMTNRSNEDRRTRLAGLDPLSDALDRMQLSALSVAIDARTYVLSGEDSARARYGRSLIAYVGDRDVFTAAAVPAEREQEAAEIAGTADGFVEATRSVVAARNRGDLGEAIRISSEDAQPRLDSFQDLGSSLRAEVALESAELRNDIADADSRQLLILIASAIAGALAASMLVGLAYGNRRLARRVGAEQRRLNEMVATVPGIVWETMGRPGSDEQRVVFVSGYAERMTGIPREEWLGSPDIWRQLIVPEDRERAFAEVRQVFEESGMGAMQYHWATRDGRIVDVLTHMMVLTDDAGRPAGLRGVSIDVTERVRAETVLRFASEAGSALFSSLDIPATLRIVAQMVVPEFADWCAVHLLDDDGVPRQVAVTHADPAKVEWALELQRRFPPDPQAAAGVYQVVRTGKAELVHEIPEDVLERSARDDEHLRAIRQVGFRSYICVPMIARGRVVGALSLVATESGRRYVKADLEIARDIALRAAVAVDNARLYQDVENERARFASMVGSVALGVYQIDADGKLVYMNPAAESLLGHSLADFGGLPVHDTLHPTHPDGRPHPFEECPVSQVARGGDAVNLLDSFIRKDGRRIDVEVSSSPVIVEGKSVGAVMVFQDVSGRIEQDRMKDDFLAFASHELRSPLTTVGGFAKWLARRAESAPERFDEESREAIETLSQGADRMASIVELFLDLTRIESGRLLMELDSVDLAATLNEEVAALAHRYPSARVETKIPSGPLLGQSDETRLRQVLTNLLENAVKYGGAPAHVRAAVEVEAESATITIRDNGDGIPEADRPFVFERFYRGSAHGTRKGLGIGLFVSKQIVDRLGGSLTFESGTGGTEFRLRLPLDTNPTAEPRTGDARPQAAERR